MTLHESKQGLKLQLADQFDAIELNSLLSMLFEHVTGNNQLQQVIHKNDQLSEVQVNELKKYGEELAKGKPIQYILGKAWFMGKEYMGVARSTFLISPNKSIAYAWPNVKTKGHAEAVLKKIKELAAI